MKKSILLFLILSFELFIAQIEKDLLKGEWYMYKIETKDGGRPFLLKNIRNKNFNIVINKSNYILVNDQILFSSRDKIGLSTNYSLVKNFLITSPESSLSIDKLTKDSLVLSQNIINIEKKDLQKYYYVRKEIIWNKELKQNIGKDTLFATNIVNPTFKLNLNRRMLKPLSMGKPVNEKDRNINFKFNGYILINTFDKKINYILDSYDAKLSQIIKEKIKPLLNISNWDISLLKNFKIIKVPFSFTSYYELNSELESYGELYNLYSTDFDLADDNNPTFQQLQESDKFFKSALEQYKNNNLNKSIELFDQSVKANPKNLDAYYNSASINFAVGNKVEACKIWKFLKNEGQIVAKKEYDSKCVK